MSNLYCSRTVSVTGEVRKLSTVYRYQPTNLLISYGVAIACGLASIIVGFVAFRQNMESYDTKVSTIGAMMQNPEVSPQSIYSSSNPVKLCIEIIPSREVQSISLPIHIVSLLIEPDSLHGF